MIADQTWDTILNMILNNFDKTAAKLYYSQTGSLQLINIKTLVLLVFWQSGPWTYMYNLIYAIYISSSMCIICMLGRWVSMMCWSYCSLLVTEQIWWTVWFSSFTLYTKGFHQQVFSHKYAAFLKDILEFSVDEVLACVSRYHHINWSAKIVTNWNFWCIWFSILHGSVC